jgi:hypothetical protein
VKKSPVNLVGCRAAFLLVLLPVGREQFSEAM